MNYKFLLVYLQNVWFTFNNYTCVTNSISEEHWFKASYSFFDK